MNPLSQDALDTLFLEARTHRAWLNQPVSDDLLHQIYDVMKFGPTSANSCPARFVFLKSKEAKGYGDVSKLYPRGPRLAFGEACKIL